MPTPHARPLRPHPGAFLLLLLCSLPTSATVASPAPAPADPALAPLATLAADLRLNSAQLAALDAGEPVVARSPAAGDDGPGLAYRVLATPADRLFRAVTDWSHYAEFFPFVVASELETPAAATSSAAGIRVRQRVDLPFPFPDRRLTVEATWTRRPGNPADGDHTPGAPAPYEAAWRYVAGSGNVDSQEGRWRLWHLGTGRTLVELRLASDAGAGVPDGLEAKALADTLPWALDGLRQQVDRCRYDLPIHPTCGEAPPAPAVTAPKTGSRADDAGLAATDPGAAALRAAPPRRPGGGRR